jgi:hypothetical protein
MMRTLSFRRALAFFHTALGLVVFLQSIGALRRALYAHPAAQPHIVVLAGVEALAAILFLIPKTIDIGGTVLLIIFAVALVLHGVRGQLMLFVYAAGVILVMVHGSTFSKDLLRIRKDST